MSTPDAHVDSRAGDRAEPPPSACSGSCADEDLPAEKLPPPEQMYDVHSRFAHQHLRTHAQRAVYFTLVAQIAQSWSAAELASLKGLEAHTVEAVLDRYAQAGIVEPVDSTIEVRYRWCADMPYLLDRQPNTVTGIDPVCGMTVPGGTPHWLQDASGTQWLFCSAFCLAAFRANPRNHCPAPATPSQPDAGTSGATRLPLGVSACPRQHDVAVFVLGVLTLAEERELTTHVDGCPACQSTLNELSDLPRLLALVPRSIAESLNNAAVQETGPSEGSRLGGWR